MQLSDSKVREFFFIERTKEFYPSIWGKYLQSISHEKMSRDELQSYNFEQRKRILKFAYENTKFYYNFYSSVDLHPNDIKTESDWELVPILTKEMVLNHFEQIKVSEKAIKDYGRSNNTGGSTGKPLKLFNDSRWSIPIVEWRVRGWWQNREPGESLHPHIGIIGQNEIYLWRLNGVESNFKKQLAGQISTWPMKRLTIDAQQLIEETIQQFIHHYKILRPAYLHGYAGAMDQIATYCIQNRIVLPSINGGISSVSTPLNQSIRRHVRSAFSGSVIYDMYACNEASWMASECGKSKTHCMHVHNDLRHIDIIDNFGKTLPFGVEGSVAVTVFTNHVFPFIKYNIGDRATLIEKPCDCGLPFPLISPIKGRETDFLVCKDGFKAIGFSTYFDDYPDATLGFQFIEHEDFNVILKVVPNKNYPYWENEVGFVFNQLREKYLGRLNFTLELVSEIPHDYGKIRFIVHKK